MENMNGALMIGIAFALVLLIAAMRSKTELLINFIMRAGTGDAGNLFYQYVFAVTGLCLACGNRTLQYYCVRTARAAGGGAAVWDQCGFYAVGGFFDTWKLSVFQVFSAFLFFLL